MQSEDKQEYFRRLRREHAAFISSLQPWNGKGNKYSSGGESSRDMFSRLVAAAQTPSTPSPRVLVVYTYADAPWRERNLRFFLKHGLIPTLADGTPVDYTIVFHGPAPLRLLRELNVAYQVMVVTEDRRKEAEAETLLFGNPDVGPLVRIVMRDNVGFDFCAARLVLERGWAARPGSYTRFVLMNASVRGPFLPSYAAHAMTWLDAFLSQLKGVVHMVGTTVNCLNSQATGVGGFVALHLQSMVLALDTTGLQAIIPMLQCYATMIEAISYGEVGSSQALLAAGHGLVAMQGSWRGFVITKEELRSKELARRCSAVTEASGGDPSLPSVYLGGDLHPLELLFIKTNRNFDETSIERWSSLFDTFK
jgi:hypothetical protein